MTSSLRLTTADIDERIEAVRVVLDRTTARLVELDADVTRRLLETTSELRGATAAAWADAARRHEALWEGQLALERLLERMADERGTRRSVPQWVLVRLDALLQGPSVELPRSDEVGVPRLTEQLSPTVSCSIAEAFDRMSADFDVVTRLLAAVAQAWGETTERLRRVGAVLAELHHGDEAQGVRRPNDLDPLSRDLQNAETMVRHDPMALDPDWRDPAGGEGPTSAGPCGGDASRAAGRERQASGGGAGHRGRLGVATRLSGPRGRVVAEGRRARLDRCGARPAGAGPRAPPARMCAGPQPGPRSLRRGPAPSHCPPL